MGVNVLALLSYVLDTQKLHNRASKRGVSPSFFFFPLPLPILPKEGPRGRGINPSPVKDKGGWGYR